MPALPKLAVAGVGNLLRSDDGVGVHAIRALQAAPPGGAALYELGTAILHGLPLVEDASRLLVIDAARGGQAPGTIYRFEAGQCGAVQPFNSIHSLGLVDALRFLQPDRPAPRVTVLGVEPAMLDFGMELSPAILAALPRVIALARDILTQWRHETAPQDLTASLPEPALA